MTPHLVVPSNSIPSAKLRVLTKFPARLIRVGGPGVLRKGQRPSDQVKKQFVMTPPVASTLNFWYKALASASSDTEAFMLTTACRDCVFGGNTHRTMTGRAVSLASPSSTWTSVGRNLEVMGSGPMKPGVAESLEASTSTKLWSASIVIGIEAMPRDSVFDDSTDDDGVMEDGG